MSGTRGPRPTRTRSGPKPHRPAPRRIPARQQPPAPQAEPAGLTLTTQKGALNVKLNLTLRRKDAWLALLAGGVILLLLASSINEDIRSILVEALVGLLQVLIFGERKNR